MKKEQAPVIVKQIFKASVQQLWQAITEPTLMRQWFFENIPDFKAEKGFETQFNVSNAGRNFLHLWRVTEVVPLKKICYDWKYQGYAGDSSVEFELIPAEKGTILKLSHHVLEDFPDDIPEFSRESCLAGWHYFIRQSLNNFLDNI